MKDKESIEKQRVGNVVLVDKSTLVVALKVAQLPASNPRDDKESLIGVAYKLVRPSVVVAAETREEIVDPSEASLLKASIMVL